jgi:hypothetical protein
MKWRLRRLKTTVLYGKTILTTTKVGDHFKTNCSWKCMFYIFWINEKVEKIGWHKLLMRTDKFNLFASPNLQVKFSHNLSLVYLCLTQTITICNNKWNAIDLIKQYTISSAEQAYNFFFDSSFNVAKIILIKKWWDFASAWNGKGIETQNFLEWLLDRTETTNWI